MKSIFCIHVGVIIFITACASGSRFEYDDALVVEHDAFQEKTKNEHDGFLFSEKEYFWPANGKITSYFGPRWGRMHTGIDISNRKNSPIFSVDKGKVVFAGWKRGYGKTIIIEHNGFQTLYAHCTTLKVRKGFPVRKGQKIGSMGVTGNARGVHLHFEWRNEDGHPLDPLRYLPKKVPKNLMVESDEKGPPTSFL